MITQPKSAKTQALGVVQNMATENAKGSQSTLLF